MAINGMPFTEVRDEVVSPSTTEQQFRDGMTQLLEHANQTPRNLQVTGAITGTVASPADNDNWVLNTSFATDPVRTFLNLEDVSATTLGAAGQFVQVVDDGMGNRSIDFTSPTFTTSFVGLTDTPTSLGTAGQLVVVNDQGDSLVFTDPTGARRETFADASARNAALVAWNPGDLAVTMTSTAMPGTTTRLTDIAINGNGFGSFDGIINLSMPRAVYDTLIGELMAAGVVAGTTTDETVTRGFDLLLGTAAIEGRVTLTVGDRLMYDGFQINFIGATMSTGPTTTGQDEIITAATSEITDGPTFIYIGENLQMPATTMDDDWFELAGDNAISFTSLTDTPSSLGTAGQVVTVNSAGDGLVFSDVATSFASLTDTPSSLGTSGQIPAVNSAGDALEFIDAPSAGSSTFTGLTDTPSSLGTAGQFVAVNSNGNGLEFVAAPSGGGTGPSGGGVTRYGVTSADRRLLAQGAALSPGDIAVVTEAAPVRETPDGVSVGQVLRDFDFTGAVPPATEDVDAIVFNTEAAANAYVARLQSLGVVDGSGATTGPLSIVFNDNSFSTGGTIAIAVGTTLTVRQRLPGQAATFSLTWPSSASTFTFAFHTFVPSTEVLFDGVEATPETYLYRSNAQSAAGASQPEDWIRIDDPTPRTLVATDAFPQIPGRPPSFTGAGDRVIGFFDPTGVGGPGVVTVLSPGDVVRAINEGQVNQPLTTPLVAGSFYNAGNGQLDLNVGAANVFTLRDMINAVSNVADNTPLTINIPSTETNAPAAIRGMSLTYADGWGFSSDFANLGFLTIRNRVPTLTPFTGNTFSVSATVTVAERTYLYTGTEEYNAADAGTTHFDFNNLTVLSDGISSYGGRGDVPATATSPGLPGEIAYDMTHMYICVAQNVWRRVAIAAW